MKYFKEKEFNMGGEIVFDKMNPVLLKALDEIREEVKNYLIINSSYRSAEYNKLIGGSERSQHLLGNAVDLKTTHLTGIEKYRLIKSAMEKGLSIGIYKTFIHIDCRNTQSVMWTG